MSVDVASAAPSWRDYLELCKPRVVVLMLICAAVGMFLATPSSPPLSILVFGLLGIGMVAGSAAAINHIADAHIDARMARTAGRPLPGGRLTAARGALFAAVLVVSGTTVLSIFTNPLTVALNLASWGGYGFLYTLFLKRATAQNIVIGGLFGAAPPLLGWSAVTGAMSAEALLLVAIIFAWTPPHFWALALDRKDEYAKVGIPMLPVIHGDAYTKWQILLYTLLLTVCTLLMFSAGFSGHLYLFGALILDTVFLVRVIDLLLDKGPRPASAVFRYSITYLALLFGLLLVDHYFPSGHWPLSSLRLS